MTVVVLGWDALDADNIEAYNTQDAFGEPHEIDTIVNDELGTPHTYEVWPSIITGEPPSVHGVHATHYTSEPAWDSRMLRVLHSVSRPVPDRVRWRVGRWLRSRGAGFEFTRASEYTVDTVFDSLNAFVLGVPNYRTRVDDEYGVAMDRGAELTRFLEMETGAGGETVQSPTVDAWEFLGRIGGMASRKLGIALTQALSGYEVVWVWLGYLDSVGHVAPTVSTPSVFENAGYQAAAAWTDMFTQLGVGPVVCVSDHGLQDGEHTETAVVSSPTGLNVEGVRSVLDIRDYLEAVIARDDSPRREGLGRSVDSVRGVRRRLEDLGYV